MGNIPMLSTRKSGAEVFKSLSLCGVGCTPSDLLSAFVGNDEYIPD